MKHLIATAALLACIALPLRAQNTISVTDRYKYYDGEKTGRLVEITPGNGITDVLVDGKKICTKTAYGKTEAILPDGIGVSRNDTVTMQLISGGTVQEETVAVPKMRHWTILLYHHSHVDIGYTHTHEIVEFVHRQNIDQAIELCEKTKDYPEDARFVWNTEVSWAVEKYLAKASPEKRERFLEAVRKGQISVDAAYVNTNTSAAHEPELLELYSTARRLSDMTGVKSETMVMVDIPGITWGIPAIAEITGVKNFLSLPNAGDRVGRSGQLNYHPRFWTGPDGKSKILFIQPGPYYTKGSEKRNYFFFKNLGIEDSTKMPKIIKTDNPRAKFIDEDLKLQLPIVEADSNYIYDIIPLAWCMSDNVPIDADLPDAVKSWNEEFAYPHLKICSSRDIVEAYRKYEETIPTVTGDYTEYWTDGLGTSAKHTGYHREVKERLMQAEILSCITGNALPEEEIKDAWLNSIMGTEHTWAYIYPSQYPSEKILGVKYSYFTNTDSLSRDLLKKAMPAQSDNSGRLAVFNTEAFTRGGLVTIDANGADCVVDAATGNEITSQILSDGRLAFMASNIPALSSKTYILKKKGTAPEICKPERKDCMDNGITSVTLDPYSGDIVGIRTGGREFVSRKFGVNANTYRYLKGADISALATKAYDTELAWKEYGPVVKTLSVMSKADGCNSLTREITLLEGERYVHITDIVDKMPVTDKEGVHIGFSFDITDPKIHADVPWGYMQINRDQWPEGNRNWIAAQRWINVSDSAANVTVCALNSPLFELGDLTANVIGSGRNFPWLKEAMEVPTVWFWVMNNHWHTNFRLSQEETVPFKYIIDPSEGPFDIAKADRFAMTQSRSLIACRVDKDFNCGAPFGLDTDSSVEVACIRPIDGGKSMLVFLHSFSDSDRTAVFNLPKGAKSYLCDAYGKTAGPAASSFTVPAKGITVVRINR